VNIAYLLCGISCRTVPLSYDGVSNGNNVGGVREGNLPVVGDMGGEVGYGQMGHLIRIREVEVEEEGEGEVKEEGEEEVGEVSQDGVHTVSGSAAAGCMSQRTSEKV